MIKKYKRVNLSTFMEEMERTGKFVQGMTEVYLAKTGYYCVVKEGITRLYSSASDAWRSL